MALFGKDALRSYLLSPDATLHEAMAIIDRGGLRIALVVDGAGRLVGTLTDGDVRRGLLRGLGIGDPIETVYCARPTTGLVDDSRSVILQKALDGRHQQIPILDDRGCPVGIEEIHELVRPARRANPVVIMAGGLGNRLRPLTASTPKPMLRVGNKPILEHILEKFRAAGFVNFLISVNYLAHVIKNHFGDGAAYGVHIDYIEEDTALGTAGALGLAADRLREPFLVMNGDLLTDLDFATLLEYHLAENAVATMCVRQYDFEIPFGVVKVADNAICAIEEKPVHQFLVNAGIYAISPQALEMIHPGTRLDMPDLFQRLLKEGKKTASFLLHEYWLDIGRRSDFEQARRDIEEYLNERA